MCVFLRARVDDIRNASVTRSALCTCVSKERGVCHSLVVSSSSSLTQPHAAFTWTLICCVPAGVFLTAACVPRYQCTFPAMIAAWRAAWAIGTGGQTDPQFPFGFVQLSVWGDPTNPPHPGEYVATVRYGQTANYGYAPNPMMPRTFMATAVDLGAYQGGCGRIVSDLCIHPGWKAAVGARLASGALAIAYGRDDAYFGGPIFVSATTKGRAVVIVFRNTGSAGIGLVGAETYRESHRGDCVCVCVRCAVCLCAYVYVSVPQPSYMAATCAYEGQAVPPKIQPTLRACML